MSSVAFNNLLILVLDSLAVFLQLLAAWFGYSIYKFNRLSKGWLAIVVGFLIQAVRRAVQLYSDSQGFVLNVILDRALMVIISLLIFIGLWSMLKNFENFEFVKDNVRRKIKR